MYLPGDIILTRNTEEVGNDSPGYWNHTAMAADCLMDGKNTSVIVEAQIDLGVAVFHEIPFRERYPYKVVIRYMVGGYGEYAAQQALNFVGEPYEKLGSIFLRRKGENCVSVVRKAWSATLGRNLRWRRPDHIYKDAEAGKRGFHIVQEEHTTDWVKPTEWFAGRIA